MKTRLDDLAVFTGRLLIAALFLGGAVQKALSPGGTTGLLADWQLPLWLIWPAFGFNALAGLALVFGVQVRAVAVLLALYCGVTSVFHFLPDDPWQMTIFVKNWAIAGGLLVLAGHAARHRGASGAAGFGP